MALWLITIASGEDCENYAFGYVCLSGWVTKKLLLRLTWFFHTRSIMPMVWPSSMKHDPDLDSRIYLRIRHHWETKYDIIVRYDVKRALWWKHALWHHVCVIARDGQSSLIASLLLHLRPTYIWNTTAFHRWHQVLSLIVPAATRGSLSSNPAGRGSTGWIKARTRVAI